MRVSKGLKQAYDVQDFAYAALMALRGTLSKDGSLAITRDDATAIGQLVCSWEAAQERIRIHRGKPLPGSLKPVSKARKKSMSAPFAVTDDADDSA